MLQAQLLIAVLASLYLQWAHCANPLKLIPIALPVEGNTAQPNVVATRHGFVLSWQQKDAAGCTTLLTTTLDASGVFGKVRRVASGCNWFVNWTDFPGVTIAANGDWLTYWLQKSQADPYAYDIHVSRSTNAGRTWSASMIPHTDATPTEHGFVSMAPLGADRVLMIWLDGRRTVEVQTQAAKAQNAPTHSGHAAHEHGAEGPMTLRSVEIDRAGKLNRPQEIDVRVCSCCSTDLVAIGGGALALFRDRSMEEIRDIAYSRYQNGRWQAPKSVHADGWKIAGCPTNGPALAVVAGRALAVWPTLVNEQLEVRAKFAGSADAPMVIERGDGVLGRPDVAAYGAGVLVSWLGQSHAPGKTHDSALKLRWLGADLKTLVETDVAVLGGGRSIGVPKLAVFQDQAVLVWTESAGGGLSQVRAIRVLK